MKFKLRINARYFNDDKLLKDLRRVANVYGKKSITQKEYNLKGLFSHKPFYKRFGSWNKALTKAELKATQLVNITDKTLFDNLEAIWKKFGRQPFYSEIRKPLSKFSIDVYCRRFGSWLKACEVFIKYKQGKPEFVKSVCVKSNGRARNINEKDRLRILKRDNYACVICGKSPATQRGITLHIDHIKPFSKGGESILKNFRTLCNECNLGKGSEEGL